MRGIVSDQNGAFGPRRDSARVREEVIERAEDPARYFWRRDSASGRVTITRATASLKYYNYYYYSESVGYYGKGRGLVTFIISDQLMFVHPFFLCLINLLCTSYFRYRVSASGMTSSMTPKMNSWSRMSTLLEISFPDSESVLARIKFSLPIISHWKRVATRRLMCSAMGTRTLPERWPH